MNELKLIKEKEEFKIIENKLDQIIVDLYNIIKIDEGLDINSIKIREWVKRLRINIINNLIYNLI